MKKVLFWALGLAAAIQLVRPDFTNPPVDEKAALNTDPQVMAVLKNSCYDCHSGETKYPWYHHIAPVSWVMSDHITRGRKALDFSNWANIDPEIKLLRMERAKQLVSNDLMPKHEYLWMHENAALKPDEKEILNRFFDAQITELDDSNTSGMNMSHDYSTM